MLLSVLDQSPIAEGSTGAQALRNTIDLAQLTDALGYHRYWVAEHHGGPMLAGPSPEVLIGPIAAATEEIRVGSGGVMLPHYSPLKVAESFSILAALYPGRIDLGLGRAAGTDPLTTFALQRDRRQAAPDDFPQQLAELLAYFDDDLPADHPFRHLAKRSRAGPSCRCRGCWARRRRARSGPASSACPTRLPTSSTRPVPRSPRPTASAFSPAATCRRSGPRLPPGCCARRPTRRRELWRPRSRMAFTLLRRGQLIEVPPPEEALGISGARGQSAADDAPPGGARSSARPRRSGPASSSSRPSTSADEVIVVTITYDHGARRRSYELLAEAMDLEPRALQATSA